MHPLGGSIVTFHLLTKFDSELNNGFIGSKALLPMTKRTIVLPSTYQGKAGNLFSNIIGWIILGAVNNPNLVSLVSKNRIRNFCKLKTRNCPANTKIKRKKHNKTKNKSKVKFDQRLRTASSSSLYSEKSSFASLLAFMSRHNKVIWFFTTRERDQI